MTDNALTCFDPTPAESTVLLRVHGAYDGATALRQLREYPLAPTDHRFYTDQTGRFFEDWSIQKIAQVEQNAKKDPIFQDLMSEILKS